jgi:hypothetical protein
VWSDRWFRDNPKEFREIKKKNNKHVMIKKKLNEFVEIVPST